MYKYPEDLESKYRFVTLASKRAEQLQSGAPARVTEANRKATVIAQAEVAMGYVDVWNPEQETDAAEPIEEEEEE
jgi:DNA-directed RNA polymerase omega subunit